MKNIGLIMLLLFSLVGCKTRNSHVVKSSFDSSYVNREHSNIGIVAVGTRGISSVLKMDSSWTNLIKLKGFTGTITPDGKIQGNAEEAELNQTGTKNQDLKQDSNSKDSTNFKGTSDVESEGEVNKKDLEKDTESNGFEMPWFAWIIAITGLLALLYMLLKTI